MAWRYEIRGSGNRLVELRSGFETEKESRDAGERARRMIDCICYPNLETLSLVIKEDGSTLGRAFGTPAQERSGTQPAELYESNVRYPWQQAVLDAFLEPHPANLSRKVNIAERAISTRLLESDPFELDERIALGEALLALRRLTREQADARNESRERKDIA